MAIKSALNPGAIVKERPITVSAAQNFITGGAPLGQSVLSSAANKIVGFQRGGSGVAPRTSDLGSIINTLSSSVVSNVENRLQSINQNVVNIVNNKLKGIESDYRDKVSKIDSDKPNSILRNFLSLYKDAIGYIQFLGNKKNVKTLGDNLQALQKIFGETFGIAKLVRQTIVKIVAQLSNLPAASGGGGGLNLDIKIPGAPLRRGGSNILNAIKRRPGVALGGALVAGGLGSRAVSGMLDIGGGDVAAAPTGDMSGGLSGGLLDRFNNILDRFSVAINSLSKQKSAPSGGGGGTTGAAKKSDEASPSPASPGSGETSDTPAGPAKDLVTGAKGFMDMGFTKQGAAYLSGNVQAESSWQGQRAPWVLNDDAGTNKGLVSWNRGRITKAEKFLGKPLNKATNEEQMKFIKHELETERAYAEANKIFKDPNASDADLKRASYIYLGYGDSAAKAEQGRFTFAKSALKGLGGYTPGSRGVVGKTGTPEAPGRVDGKPGVAGKSTVTTVTAADAQSTTAQQVSQTVAQQPGANQPSNPLMVPINLAGQQQTQPSAPENAPTPPPILSSQGTQIPNISSSNFDNFLTLYSKMTYNIVEG